MQLELLDPSVAVATPLLLLLLVVPRVPVRQAVDHSLILVLCKEGMLRRVREFEVEQPLELSLLSGSE